MGEFLKMPREDLLVYLAKQIENFFPDRAVTTRQQLDGVLDEAIDRLACCIDNVRMWRGSGFHPLHSEKNAIFLYYVANSLFRHNGDRSLCEKLFYLNKALNGFHCFYDTELPDIFFIGHSIGIVLVKTRYPRYLVLYQGTTIGKNHGAEPVLEEGIVLYPGSSIIGGCHIGARTIISANTTVDQDTPGSCLVFRNSQGLIFKQPKHDILSDFFFL